MSIQKLEYYKFMNEIVYDWSCRIGTMAKNTDKTTVNNIIENFKGDPVEACKLLMYYIARQSARKEIDIEVAKQLVNDIYQIYNNFKDNKDNLDDAVRKYLILFKWIYEFEHEFKKEFKSTIGGNNFQEFINNFIRERQGSR